MSRSRRKPYFTDQQSSSVAWQSKRAANRRIRQLEVDEAPSRGKQYKKEYCSWDIRDWSFHSPLDKKAYRK